MLRGPLTWLILFVYVATCLAQQLTTTNHAGATIVETVSVDQWTETWTEIVSTVTATTRKKAVLTSTILTTSATAQVVDLPERLGS
ncbi:MAG: hypothetical protein TREMPRED_000892 [Tremellales sp. Tagirdzhanova-0007]|nr:MAG: hypothetical protein TREMPRED_000892 [Tremellales sp. Tagirdzhanova-0007]